MLGKSRITDPGGNALFRKSPIVDFANGSVLIVPPYCEALYVNRGDLYHFAKQGAYELHTGQSPFFSELQNWSSKGKPLTISEVYFYNVQSYMEASFITDEIPIIDMRTGTTMEVSGYGKLRLTIQDGKQLFKKLVAGRTVYTKEMLAEFLEIEINPLVTQMLQREFMNRTYQDVMLKLNEFSLEIGQVVQRKLAECGLRLENAQLTHIRPKEQDLTSIKNMMTKTYEAKIETTVTEDLANRLFGGDLEKAMKYELMKAVVQNPGNVYNPATYPMMYEMGRDLKAKMSGNDGSDDDK